MMLFLIFFILIIVILFSIKYGGEVQRNYELYHKIEEIYFKPLYNRVLSNIKTEKFFRVHHREVLVLKLGQRKLFFNELELYTITFHALQEKCVKVIYAGSAPGIHSTLLAELFPNFQFHYYDMNPFFEKLKEYKNIYLYHQYFTDEDALSFAPSFSPSAKKKEDKEDIYTIFISDIRSGEDEDSVERDMEMQKKWVELMQPDACMLKFRLRWEPATHTEYFDGDIYFQPRIGFSSTETRLIFFPTSSLSPMAKEGRIYAKKIYDTEEYNNQMFYFQRHHRNAFHEFKISSFLTDNVDTDIFPLLAKEIKGLCHCNDCWSEIKICIDFLKLKNPLFLYPSSYENDINKIIELMEKISDHTKSTLDTPPHNLLVNEKDINKRIKLLEKLSIKNAEKAADKINKQKKERKIY